MFALAVQPPAQTKSGATLYPPIVARLSSDTNIFEELSQIWAVVSLISLSGEVLHETLEGKVADSAHPMAESGHGSAPGGMKDRAYFYFPDLVIRTPGRYRVRVTLMRMSYSSESSPEGDVRYDEYIDTHSILVDEGVSNQSRPSECHIMCEGYRTVLTTAGSRERRFLRILKEDGQDVPSPGNSPTDGNPGTQS